MSSAHDSGELAGSQPVGSPGTGAPSDAVRVDVVVIGAGFSGMYALHTLSRMGLSLRAFEAGDGPGGTWYWNRYPGARVDIESMVYSYSFDEELEQEWRWPEHFSPQPDIEAYANHVCDRFGLREQITFSARVNELRFDDDTSLWHVQTDRGDHVVARYVIAATGSLNADNVPPFPGLDSFAGQWYHTSRWPREGVDFAGKRVGVIGTGSTGIQVIPVVAETAAELTVFQRTPNFTIPSNNRPLDPEYERNYKVNYRKYREMMKKTATAAVLSGQQFRSVFEVTDEERKVILDQAWNAGSGFGFMATFSDIRTDVAANEVVAEYVRGRIREVVTDSETAELLCPKGYPIGAKRLCLDSGYYETFNRDNVHLVDVRTHPILEVTPRGVRTAVDEYDLDVLIYATGFDAMTGAMTRMNVTGAGGRLLTEHWTDGPANYLGFVVAGFPNLLMLHGPGSPSVLAQMIMGAEWQVDYVASLIAHMEKHGHKRVDTTPDWEQRWAAEVERAANQTLYPRAESWYSGANIEGKPRVFMVYIGGFDRYCALCEEAAARDYEGYVFS